MGRGEGSQPWNSQEPLDSLQGSPGIPLVLHQESEKHLLLRARKKSNQQLLVFPTVLLGGLCFGHVGHHSLEVESSI